jgi:hypothetical protein
MVEASQTLQLSKTQQVGYLALQTDILMAERRRNEFLQACLNELGAGKDETWVFDLKEGVFTKKPPDRTEGSV